MAGFFYADDFGRWLIRSPRIQELLRKNSGTLDQESYCTTIFFTADWLPAVSFIK